jgi:chromosome segregation protein
VHLRSIHIRGFKSFPDPVEVRLEPGVAVVVGPNGSGKSNIADALVWASGSQAPSELRAEKPDDVLFAGSAGHSKVSHCEVELLFDNAQRVLDLDFAEVSIARRLHHGGEGQYLVNGATVRRIDLVELLADVGLGPGGGAVVGQGKVESILASRPDERRALVEDAAGLGRFKRRRHRAELKLARVAQQVERARDVEAEVAKRLRPLALQASAAERAERLAGEIAQVRAGIAAHDLREIDVRLANVASRRQRAVAERAELDRRIEALLAERAQAEDDLAAVAGGHEGAAAALYRLRSARERVEVRRETAQALLERIREPVAVPTDQALREQAALAEARATAVERALAEREGLPPAARALAEEGQRLALDLIEVEPGYERAVAAALGHRAAALHVEDRGHALELLERARSTGLGSLSVLVGSSGGVDEPGSLSAHVRPRARGEGVAALLHDVDVVEAGRLLDAVRPSVTLEGHCFDPGSGELRFAGETAEALLLELEAQARRLRAEALELGRRAASAEPLIRPADPRLVSIADRLCAALAASIVATERLEHPLLEQAEGGSTRAAEIAAELRRLGAGEAEVRREAAEAAQRAAEIDIEAARLEGEIGDARRRLQEANAEPAEGARDELAARLDRLERRREQLGNVNPFAKEEYEREKAHLAELAEQREDLELSLRELEKLRAELTETVERRFTETFSAVERNFAEVASTLFPGGEGRLRLTEVVEGEEPGIEVELRPAGKRITRLSLLSGGEKALGALSFLFALFLARPCPFYLLDEVEAALDDTNIGRFVELLRRFSTRAQFIVITHQKRTMEAADILYGVTMGKDGVSQVVSRRLPREDASALSA